MYEQALELLKGERKRIDTAIHLLEAIDGNGAKRNGRKRRHMSAAARRRISQAMRANWRKRKAA